ncbi:UBX domain-containing protein 1 [Brachionichthys hirsutus]|uniref:UBX domain-containing protein 1 n=1 Tax=Brachionichthys hirsutus TaxID=412623 RepID=UPI0036047B01
MEEQTTLESLLEMGFERNRAERAVANTGDKGIGEAMDWLMEHENDPDADEPCVPPEGNTLGEKDASQSPSEGPTLAETTEESTGTDGDDQQGVKRPMSEEEKHEQVKRLEELMRVKQAERRQREREEELEREKQRRKHGQELQQIRQKLQENDMKKLTDDRRREKMEDKMARQRVKEKIARDREERAQKFGGCDQPSTAASSQPAQPSLPSPTSHGPPPTKKEYDESRIQVRLLDGSAISTVFKAQEQLAAVRLYVKMNSSMPEGEDFTLLSPYPRHVYTDLDMEKSLKELGLVPSAVLVVAKK